MTQAQIGLRLGISQMHVSRLRAHALGYLRSRLLDLQEHSVADGGPAAAPQPPKDHQSAQTITCRPPPKARAMSVLP
jgi:hypothetical protein